MGTSEIVTLIISSSVLSAILTGFVNFRIHNLNYKREYYKKIIERRIKAQEQILNLTNELRLQVQLDNGTLCNRICASGEEHFEDFSMLGAEYVNISFWLSRELSGILQEFNVFLLNEITHELIGENDSERESCLIKLGIDHDERIRAIKSRIEQQLMKDFKSLSDVNSFVNSKPPLKGKIYMIKKITLKKEHWH